MDQLDARFADEFIALEVIEQRAVQRFALAHGPRDDRDHDERKEEGQQRQTDADRRVDDPAIVSRKDADAEDDQNQNGDQDFLLSALLDRDAIAVLFGDDEEAVLIFHEAEDYL